MALTGKMGSHERAGTAQYERAGLYKKSKRHTKDKKLNSKLQRIDRQYKEAIQSAAGTDLLLQEEQGFLEAEK